MQTVLQPPPAILNPRVTRLFALVAVAAGLLVGLAAGLGMPQNLLIGAALSPFLLILIYARPHWPVTIYVVLVYADLLSILVKYHDFPPLARFAGAIMLSAVLGYRLVFRRERLRADTVTPWLLAYGLVVALGLFYARDPGLVMPNVVEFIRNFLTYLIIVNALTNTHRLKATLWAVLVMGTFLSLLSIYQIATGHTDTDFGGLAQYRVSEITSDTDAARPGGTLGDANYYGQSLLILVPLGFYFAFTAKRVLGRLAGVFCLLVLVGGVVFTYSRGDAVALGAMLLAALIYKRPRPIFLIGLLLAAAVAVPVLPANYVARLGTIVGTATGGQQAVLTEESIRGRAGAVQAAISMFADHPLLGVGRENYPLYQLQYLKGTALALHAKAIPPHDLYLEIATETGIVGLAVVGGMLLVVFGALREAYRRFLALKAPREAELAVWMGIGLFGYLVSSLFLHGAFLYMLWLQLALIVALRQVSRSQEVVPMMEQAPAPETIAPVLPFTGNAASRAYLMPSTASSRALLSASHGQGQDLATSTTQRYPAPATLDELFLSYWEVNGGADIFGQPVSIIFDEIGPNGLEHVPVQYYEYARFEYWPGMAASMGATFGDVALGKLGLEVPVAGSRAGTLPEVLRSRAHLPEGTSGGLAVPPVFSNAWLLAGGATVCGSAVSPVLAYMDENGAESYRQYFERACFEYYPQYAGTGYSVKRAQLGSFVFAQKYGGAA